MFQNKIKTIQQFYETVVPGFLSKYQPCVPTATTTTTTTTAEEQQTALNKVQQNNPLI